MSTKSAAPSEVREERRSEPVAIDLAPQQKVLLEALTETDAALARIYVGALRVAADPENPERLALAAHGLRELMDKLPEHLDVSARADQDRLSPRVSRLAEDWTRTLLRSACARDEQWDGQIDQPLRSFLERARAFFDWHSASRPKRRLVVGRTLARLDVSGRELPEQLVTLNFKTWEAIRDFFLAVAHHGKTSSDDIFRSWLDALERFLLDRLRPQTFDEFLEIDAIVAKHEFR